MIETGVKFGNIHSFYDLNLILAPFTPTPATPKTSYIDIQGGDGSLDLTEAHGETKYKDRDFSFTFTVNPSETMTFDEKVTQVSNALNGKRFEIVLERDAAYYWQGRCIVNNYAQDKNLKQIVVKATVQPYKLKRNATVVPVALTGGEQIINLKNGRKSVVPTIECTNDNTVVVFKDGTYTLNAGTHKILDVQLVEGSNVLKVTGEGMITFNYQEGEL